MTRRPAAALLAALLLAAAHADDPPLTPAERKAKMDEQKKKMEQKKAENKQRVEQQKAQNEELKARTAKRMAIGDAMFKAKDREAAGDLKAAAAATADLLRLQRAEHGDAERAVAFTWDKLVRLRLRAGEQAGAGTAAGERLAATEKALGRDHWLTADARRGVEDVVRWGRLSPADRQELAEADRLVAEAAGLRRAARYAEAGANAAEAAATRARVLGADHPHALTARTQFALTLRDQGLFAESELHLKAVLAGRTRALGPDHPDTLGSENNLGLILLSRQQFVAAEALFDRVIAAKAERHGSPDHPATLVNRGNKALALVGQGKLAEAAAVYEGMLAGKRGPARLSDRLQTVGHLGKVRRKQGDLRAAEELFREAAGGFGGALGYDHPWTSSARANLADVLTDQGRRAEAAGVAAAAFAAGAGYLERAAAAQSEAAQLAAAAKGRRPFDALLRATAGADARAAVLSAAADPDAGPAAVYAAVFRWRGAVTARQAFARAARTADPDARALLAQLADVTRRLGGLPDDDDADDDAPAAAPAGNLLDRRTRLEADLAGRSASFRAYRDNCRLAPADLQARLPDGVTLVDYVQYGSGVEGRLAAFVVRKGGVTRTELGAADPVAAAADAFYRLASDPTAPGLPAAPEAVALRKLVWDPLARDLAGAKVVLVCPDGPLCRVPFAALPGADPKKYLLEEVAVAVVPVPRLLHELLAAPPRPPAEPSLLAVGGVDFGPPPGGQERDRKWVDLPGTRTEVLTLGAEFRQAAPAGRLLTLTRAAATESAVRAALGEHRHVHLATHGFFSPPAPEDAPARPAGAGGAGEARSRPAGAGGAAEDAPARPTGLQSGVVLAGANDPAAARRRAREAAGNAAPGAVDDGVLSALEVGMLDLSGVDLAVLSACETGLGAVAGGEGVLGLQRAFQVAGARTTVTSLWKVDDAATQKLMSGFYAAYWDSKAGPLESLRRAQLAMLEAGPGRTFRPQNAPAPGRTPPYLWAAFALAGDWR